jgi:hypothetical protein
MTHSALLSREPGRKQGKTKGPLSWADCTKLAGQLDQVLAATRGIETKAKGEAAGLRGVGEYIPGLGTHHGQLSTMTLLPDAGSAPTTFDPGKPQFFIYGGPQANAPIVGVAYTNFDVGAAPPEGFAGGNDWWHEHNKLCMGGGGILAGAEEVSDEQCTALGGRNLQITGAGGIFGDRQNWVLHLWLPPYEYRPDLFASGNPCLLANGVAAEDDPCWQIAHRDPSLGPPNPPTTSGDHDGGHGH